MNGSTVDNLITPKELSNLLKIAPGSIYHLVNRRILPFYKVGGSLRFSKADIDKYLESVRIEPIRK